MIRNIIFDWCGTLVNDLPAVWRATNRVLMQSKVPEMTLEQFRAEFVLPFKLFYDRHTPHVPDVQLEAWFHPAFHAEQHSVEAFDHSREFLEFCRQHELRMFVLSSIHRKHFAVHLERTGFGGFFEKSYLEVRDKREEIHGLLNAHGLRREETLFIGDMQHDVETARHGGVHSCAVLTGFNTLTQLREAGPDLIVEHLGELRAILERTRFEPLSNEAVAVEPDPAQTPVVTVGGLIFNDAGRVLLVRTHKWSNLWGIPGGKTRRGETSEAALRRELREETGLEISRIEFVLVQDCIDSPEFYRPAHFILLNYTCLATGTQNVVLNDEAREHRWLKFDEAAQLELNTPTRVLLDAVREREPAFARRTTGAD